jgi:hypothetical protein
MGLSGSGGSSGSKPVFMEGQKEMATDILMSVLGPLALGGAPNPATEIAANRSREGLNQTLAQQGLSGSGLAAKSAAGLEQGLAGNDAAMRMDVINRIFDPLGQKSNSFNMGLGGSLFGSPTP